MTRAILIAGAIGISSWWAAMNYLTFPVTVEMCPMMPGMTMAEMAQQEPPQEPPVTPGPPEDDPEAPPGGHTEPTTYCLATDTPGVMACMCLAQGGCKDGHRETEDRSCKSWCWKQWCKCCLS